MSPLIFFVSVQNKEKEIEKKIKKKKNKTKFITLTLSPLQGFSSGETDFHLCQFFSNFFKYSFLNFLSSYPNNIFAMYFSGNLLLLNSSTFEFNFVFHILSVLSCLLTSVSSNSSTSSFAFSKSFSFSHISFSAINPFQHTKYFSTPRIFLLFNILSTFYSSTPSTSTGFGFSTFCPFPSFLYFTTLLTLTTG